MLCHRWMSGVSFLGACHGWVTKIVDDCPNGPSSNPHARSTGLDAEAQLSGQWIRFSRLCWWRQVRAGQFEAGESAGSRDGKYAYPGGQLDGTDLVAPISPQTAPQTAPRGDERSELISLKVLHNPAYAVSLAETRNVACHSFAFVGSM